MKKSYFQQSAFFSMSDLVHCDVNNAGRKRAPEGLFRIIRSTEIHSACLLQVQYNLNGSNPDGSFTVDDSNSFFSPYKILPTAQENKYVGIFFILNHGIVFCVYSLESPHRGDSNEYTQHTIIV